MKKVFQTKFGFPNGNCHAACIASLFDVPIDDIPDWGNRSDWYDKFTKWCVDELGVQPIDIDAENCFFKPVGYYIINGESKNGDFWHSAIGKNGEVVHDPHPDSALKNQKTFTFFIKIVQ